MSNSVLPFARAQGSNHGFAFEFMKSLSEAGLAKKIDNETVTIGLKGVLLTFIPSFNLMISRNSAKRQKTASGQTNFYGNSFAGDSIAKIINYCAVQELHNEIGMLLHKIDEETGQFDEVLLRDTLIPFLRELNKVMQKHKIGYSTNQYQRVFQSVIKMYLLKYVCHEPPAPPTDWKFSRRGCGCSDCIKLDELLHSGTRIQMEYKGSGPRRNHVESRVLGVLEISKCTRKNPRSPHSLLLHKTWKEGDAKTKEWKLRCAEATAFFQNIGSEALKTLLADRYHELAELRLIRRGNQSTIRS